MKVTHRVPQYEAMEFGGTTESAALIMEAICASTYVLEVGNGTSILKVGDFTLRRGDWLVQTGGLTWQHMNPSVFRRTYEMAPE